LGILFSSVPCTCPNQCYLYNFTVSYSWCFYPLHKHLYWLIFSNFLISLTYTGTKNPQHAFLQNGSKAVCPMSQICSM
jgi:hypothetical protein